MKITRLIDGEVGFRVTLAVITACALLVSIGGLAYSEMRASDLQQLVEQRVIPTTTAFSRIAEMQRLRASLAGALDRANESPNVRSQVPASDLRLFDRQSNRFRSVLVLQSDATSQMELSWLPLELVDESVGIHAFLWPATAPLGIIFCERAGPNRVACSSLNLASFLGTAAGSSSFGIEYGLTVGKGGFQVATTDAWKSADPRIESNVGMTLHGIDLMLTGRAAPYLKKSFGVTNGRYIALASLGIYLLVLTGLLSRRRLLKRQLKLEEAVKISRSNSDEMIRSTLRLAAMGAGILVAIIHDDERIELIGPWGDYPELEEGTTTLAEVLKEVVNGDSVRTSLVDAMHKRAYWSNIIARRVDGEILTLQANCSPVMDADGNFIAMLGIGVDITESLKTQTQVMQVDAFRSAQTTSLAYLAKEVSGPAMHLQAVLEMIGRQPELSKTPEVARLLDLASFESRRLTEVVRGSLSLMKLRNNMTPVKMTPMRVGDLLREAVSVIRAREGRSRGQDIEIIGDESRRVMANKLSLLTILCALLSNACRFSPENGRIDVRLVPGDAYLHIEIEDAGSGMTDDELKKLGEPFFRGNIPNPVPGNGLGLATALELAHQSGAKIQFTRSSVAGRGLIAILNLPWSH